MYVCVCNAVTDRAIRAAAAEGARSLDDLRETLKVATCCGRCAGCARNVLRQSLKHGDAPATPCHRSPAGLDAGLVPA